MIQNEQHLLSAFCLLPPELEGNSSWRDPRPNAVHLIGFGKSIRKLFRRAPLTRLRAEADAVRGSPLPLRRA
jgi:hypothetical protein